jgi:hypothetical protein
MNEAISKQLEHRLMRGESIVISQGVAKCMISRSADFRDKLDIDPILGWSESTTNAVCAEKCDLS